jgi:hypothetical protein
MHEFVWFESYVFCNALLIEIPYGIAVPCVVCYRGKKFNPNLLTCSEVKDYPRRVWCDEDRFCHTVVLVDAIAKRGPYMRHKDT